MVFVYLTNVDEDSGPHTLISGTHRERPDRLWADGGYSDQAITAARLDGKVTNVTGEAGTVFLVDTFCLHQGTHPEKTCRLMAQIQYSNSLFGKPVPASDHKVEMAATSKAASIQEAADLVRRYATKAGVRFMQNYI